jgi:hypothetical protein
MPSSSNYVRDLKEEDKTRKARGEVGGHDSKNAIRERDRRKALKLGMVRPGQDLDHKKALGQGGKGGDPKNWRAESPHDNRSYPRAKDGSMLVNKPKDKEG